MAGADPRDVTPAMPPAGAEAHAVRVGPGVQTTTSTYSVDTAMKTPRAVAVGGGGMMFDYSRELKAVQREQVANPAPLGLLGFGLTTAILQGANTAITESSITSFVFCYALFYGGLAQFMAGQWEFKRQNTFGAAAFSSYGGWWMSFGIYGILVSGGVLVPSGPKGEKMLLALWGIITWIFMIVTLELNFATFSLFFFLSVLFWFLTGGLSSITFTRIAGWWGLVTAGIAFYIAAADMINEQYKRTVLPVGKWNVGVPMSKGFKGFLRKIPVLNICAKGMDREDRLAGYKKTEITGNTDYERGDVGRETGAYGRPGVLHSDTSIMPASWEGAAVYRERQTGDLGSAVGPY